MSITVTITVNNARTGKAEQAAELHIMNDATGTPERGNYRYTLRTPGEVRTGSIKGHRRSHRKGAVRLVARILEKEVPFEPEHRYSGKPGAIIGT